MGPISRESTRLYFVAIINTFFYRAGAGREFTKKSLIWTSVIVCTPNIVHHVMDDTYNLAAGVPRIIQTGETPYTFCSFLQGNLINHDFHAHTPLRICGQFMLYLSYGEVNYFPGAISV